MYLINSDSDEDIPKHIQSQLKGVIALEPEANSWKQSTVVVLMNPPLEHLITNSHDIRATHLLILSQQQQQQQGLATNIMALEETLKNNKERKDLVWEITRYKGTAIPWDSVIHFFQQSWHPGIKQVPSHDVSQVQVVSYPKENPFLQGYLAVPSSSTARHPAVILLPNWDGVNLYEQQRIQLLANEGFVAMAADIYGLHHNLTLQEMIQQSTYYRETHVDEYLKRIQYAVDYVSSLPFVDPMRLGLAGYCFGGTGVIQYILMRQPAGLQVAAAFHGGLQPKYLPSTDLVSHINAHVLVLSGGSDDAHGNQSVIESVLQAADEWEISRYAGVYHGFTEWESPAYNFNADIRSWRAFLQQLRIKLQPNAEEPTRGTPFYYSRNVWISSIGFFLLVVLIWTRRRKQQQQQRYVKLCTIPVSTSRKPNQKQK